MLNFFLSWSGGYQSLFVPYLSTRPGKYANTYEYLWPHSVTVEFFLGIKLFLNNTSFPANAKIMRKRGRIFKQSLSKMLQQHILSEHQNYENGFEFDDFLTPSFDKFDQDRKMDRQILDPRSFCNKYVQGNIYKFCYKPIRMRYVADICNHVGYYDHKYKKIQFNSTDFLKGFLTLQEFVIGGYKVKIGQIYENFKLCKLIMYHPDLFYSINTIKQLLLKIIPQLYNELLDLVLSFFSYCETNKFYPLVDSDSYLCATLDTIQCENLALDHLNHQCYRCGGYQEIQNFRFQKIPLFIELKISPFSYNNKNNF